MVTAVAYYRTSSAAGLGDDKDSEKRQRDAVTKYAADNGIEIVHEYYDAAVKGSDAVWDRPEFSAMMEYMLGNGARIILVETANRFARDLMIQMTGHEFLRKQGISLIPVDCPNHFMEDTPTGVMVRQILGAVSQFEKSCLVDRMRKGINRKRLENGRCEGRKPAPVEAIEIAKKLRAEGKTLREIGQGLADAGYRVMKTMVEMDGESKVKRRVMTDRVYKPQSVKAMLGYKKERKHAEA